MKKLMKIKKNIGMSVIELLVALSIISAVSTVSIFNYGGFQSKVDVKNLATDIALKIVGAQKASLSGQLPPAAQQLLIDSTWKPSYGVYFNIIPTSENTSFIYFTDLKNPTQNSLYDASTCPGDGECLEKITITKGSYISQLAVSGTAECPATVNNLGIVFRRPNSDATITTNPAFDLLCKISYIQVTTSSSNGLTSTIKVYPSGRIQVN